MGRRVCCVLNCATNEDNNSKKSLFAPPLKDPVMIEKWEEALKPHVDPCSFPFNRKTLVCERHFKPKQLDRMFVTRLPDGSTWTEQKARSRLYPGSVPSIFTKDELSHIEVKAPKGENTYIFDFELEESCDGSGSASQIDDEEEDGDVAGEKKEKEENEVKSGESTKLDASEEQSETAVTNEELASSPKNDDKQIEIIFFGSNDDSDDGSDGDYANVAEVAEHGGAPSDDDYVTEMAEQGGADSDDNMAEVAEVSDCSTPDPTENQNSPERELKESSYVDVRMILGPPEPEKSVINDINEFSRLCRKYIATTLAKKGRPGLMDKYGLDPPDPKATEKSVFIYPKTVLDVETLVSHIDHVKFPSENWFCTVKDGSPTFLCWNENYSIHKKVIFDMKNLYPIVHLGDVATSFSEIAKPGSIHEVNNILKLVDSAQKCPQEDPSVCKGYFFPAANRRLAGANMCHPCMTALGSNSPEVQPFTFKRVNASAEEIISGFVNWSFTVLGTALIFIGWKKPYIPEKLYVLNSDLNAQVIFGGEFALLDEICSPQSIKDVRFAIKFLEGCVKCIGVDDSRRSNRCRGFVYHKTQRMRSRTCNACADLKKKLIRAVPGDSLVKRTEAKHNLSAGSLKFASKSSTPPWIKEEENSRDQNLEADEEHILLPNVLDAITLPSNRWTHTVVDTTVIFQHWKDNFTLLKKVIINHDLSVQISVLDRIVEFEEVDVSSVDDVVRILNLVDCLRVCEGYDEWNRKDEDCTVYAYDANDADPEARATPYRCPKCLALRRAHHESRKTSALKNRIQIVKLKRAPDDSEPSSKKAALEITLSPFSSRPQYPVSPSDDEP